MKNVKTSLGQKEKSANTMTDKSGFMSFMFRKRKKNGRGYSRFYYHGFSHSVFDMMCL